MWSAPALTNYKLPVPFVTKVLSIPTLLLACASLGSWWTSCLWSTPPRDRWRSRPRELKFLKQRIIAVSTGKKKHAITALIAESLRRFPHNICIFLGISFFSMTASAEISRNYTNTVFRTVPLSNNYKFSMLCCGSSKKRAVPAPNPEWFLGVLDPDPIPAIWGISGNGKKYLFVGSKRKTNSYLFERNNPPRFTIQLTKKRRKNCNYIFMCFFIFNRSGSKTNNSLTFTGAIHRPVL